MQHSTTDTDIREVIADIQQGIRDDLAWYRKPRAKSLRALQILGGMTPEFAHLIEEN